MRGQTEGVGRAEAIGVEMKNKFGVATIITRIISKLIFSAFTFIFFALPLSTGRAHVSQMSQNRSAAPIH